MTPYERVKLSRKRTASTFPLPSPLDCIRYALCELCEYEDAMLRLERIGDKRNNDRQPDPRAELGQALYMLLSAAVQWGIKPKRYDPLSQQSRLHLYSSALYWLAGFTLSPVSEHLAARQALDNARRAALEGSVSGAYNVLCALATVHGWDVDAMIDDTCAAFEAKHAAVQP